MAKRELVTVGLDQTGLERGIERVLRQLEHGRRVEDYPKLAGVFACRDQQRRPGGLPEPRDSLCEHRAQGRVQRQRLGQRLATGKLGIREAGWQLQQRKRVAGRLGQQPFTHRRRRTRCAASEQAHGRLAVQPTDHQLLEPRTLKPPLLALPSPKQNHHPLSDQPPRCEHQRIHGRHVEPLCVVDHTQHRPRLRGGCHQRQHPGRHQEAIAPLAGS